MLPGSLALNFIFFLTSSFLHRTLLQDAAAMDSFSS